MSDQINTARPESEEELEHLEGGEAPNSRDILPPVEKVEEEVASEEVAPEVEAVVPPADEAESEAA